MTENNKYICTVKDIILVGIYLILLVSDAIIYIIVNSKVSPGYIIGGIIERIVVITLSFVGLIGVGYSSGWSILVPDFFEANMVKKRNEEVHKCMETFFKNNINFLNDCSEDRIQFIMTQLGLSVAQLDKLRFELIKMRCIPIKTIEDAKKKIEYIIKCDYPIIINQSNTDNAKFCYSKVKYFINFNDLVFKEIYARELAQIISFLINENSNKETINRIIIPHDSNYLLGIEVGKIIGKPVVKMRQDKGRIETEKRWDGEILPTDKVIIVHDVLVTSEQIIQTLDMLPKTCEVLALYCLVIRSEWNGLEKIQEKNIKVHRVVDLDDKIIASIRGEADE